MPVHESTAENLAQWEKHIGTEVTIAKYNGAPRIWSHGLREINRNHAETLARRWTQTLDLSGPEQIVAQREIAKEAVEGLRMVSKTFMVDAYREGVEQGLADLRKAGKQVIICTGDSIAAATTIAQHIKMPPCLPLDGSSRVSLLVSLRTVEMQGEENPVTVVINQECCDRLREIQEQVLNAT